MKDSNGVTLISLIGTIVIIMFLIGLAITTSMKSFDKMRLESFKSELEEIQRKVDEISTDYNVAIKTNSDLTYTMYFKERHSETAPRLLLEFEEDEKISVLIKQYELKDLYKNELKDKESTFYFDKNDIKKYLGLKGLDEPVIIDFTTRIVYSVEGCKDPDDKKITYHTLAECAGENKVYSSKDKASLSTSENIVVTYDERQIEDTKLFSVTLTLNRREDISGKNFNIKKAYYSKAADDEWIEVDSLTDCKYSNNTVDFILYEEGSYIFKVEDTSGKVTITNPLIIDLNFELKNTAAAGEKVKTPFKWENEITRNISTSTGNVVEAVDKISTVYAVSDGIGNTIPVPEGFWYVGGNLDNGVIISDNEEDKYDGITDKTTWKYTTKLKGNQFVWIPCSKEEYVKTAWGKQNANWDTTIPHSEIAQVEKYGGFYVARYEAGLADTIEEYTTAQKHTGTSGIYNVDGIPQSRAGQIPWMFIDWNHSKQNAESMYNNDYVNSGLITGTQWDVILNKFIEKAGLETADLTNSSKWGNYRNTSISYRGRKSTAYYSSSAWYSPAFGEVMEGKTTAYSGNNGDLLTTGASPDTERYHVFDMAGNLWEWTEELSTYATSNQYRIYRGGGYIEVVATYSANYRGGSALVTYAGLHFGFRTVLYIK